MVSNSNCQESKQIMDVLTFSLDGCLILSDMAKVFYFIYELRIYKPLIDVVGLFK